MKPFPQRPVPGAFTIMELLVAMVILSLLLVLLASATGGMLSTVSHANARIDQFSAARVGFDLLSQTLSQATLNTYYDSFDQDQKRRTPDNAADFVPRTYGRNSDLHFKIQANGSSGQEIFFQSPLSRSQKSMPEGALNAVGYWIEFGTDDDWKPPHIATSRHRYRLMQGLQSAENLEVFRTPNADWISALREAPKSAMPIAENVIAMVIHPRLPKTRDPNGTALTTDYQYDSRGTSPIQKAQLPPSLQLTMVVIDEASAARLEQGGDEPAVIRDALAGKFRDVSKFDDDLRDLEATLRTAKPSINFLVLSSPLTLRESKFSKDP